MGFLRTWFDRNEKRFTEGSLKSLYPLYEAIDAFLFTPSTVNPGPTHVRDGIDLKRLMSVVIVALVPCIWMAFWNTGYQANLVMAQTGVAAAPGWRGAVIEALGCGYDPASLWANLVHGGLYFLPVYLVCMLVGTFWEVVFAAVRKH
ncbi:MAG: RnfABCDGE type electron transport complex subunit D, partial [Candidatus Latescibacterota bacterium]